MQFLAPTDKWPQKYVKQRRTGDIIPWEGYVDFPTGELIARFRKQFIKQTYTPPRLLIINYDFRNPFIGSLQPEYHPYLGDGQFMGMEILWSETAGLELI